VQIFISDKYLSRLKVFCNTRTVVLYTKHAGLCLTRYAKSVNPTRTLIFSRQSDKVLRVPLNAR
jgi:hypothetical protein